MAWKTEPLTPDELELELAAPTATARNLPSSQRRRGAESSTSGPPMRKVCWHRPEESNWRRRLGSWGTRIKNTFWQEGALDLCKEVDRKQTTLIQ